MISIVIASYNRKQKLLRCLDSLNKQSVLDFEVIIVDDFSETSIQNYISNEVYLFDLKMLRNKENRGPAFSRNQGVKQAKGSFILFTDDDCVFDANWVLETRESFTLLSDKIVGICGVLLSYGGDIYNKYYEANQFCNPNSSLSFGDTINSFTTAHIGLKKTSFNLVGGFDESIGYNGEDTLLFYRLKENNLNVVFNPKMIVKHQFDRGLMSMFNTQYGYGKGSAAIRGVMPAKDVPFKSYKTIFIGVLREVNPFKKYKEYKKKFGHINLSPFQAGLFALVQNAGFFWGYQRNKNK